MPECDGEEREVKRFIVVALAVMNLLALDLITKKLAAGYLKGSAAVSVIDGFFNLVYVENRGCAWGMLQGHVWPLAVFGLIALGFVVYKRKDLFSHAAVAEPLLYAGIIGNLIDRVVRGYVIDFVDLHWGAVYHFPCFNVADVLITFAAAILLVSGFFTKGQAK